MGTPSVARLCLRKAACLVCVLPLAEPIWPHVQTLDLFHCIDTGTMYSARAASCTYPCKMPPQRLLTWHNTTAFSASECPQADCEQPVVLIVHAQIHAYGAWSSC